MKKLTSYSKRVKYTYVKTTLVTIFVSLFFLKGYTVFEKTGENYFHVFLNGTEIGTVGEADRAEQLLQEARRNIASQSEDMIFIDADLKLVGEEALWGTLTGEDTMLAAMERELESSIRETSHRSYTMKVNEYMVNLSSVDEVKSLLQAAVDKYDSEEKFSVELTHDAQKEFNVLTTEVVNRQELTAQEEQILFFCQFLRHSLVKDPTLRTHIEYLRLTPKPLYYRLPCQIHRFRLHDHTGSAAVWIIIHPVMLIH